MQSLSVSQLRYVELSWQLLLHDTISRVIEFNASGQRVRLTDYFESGAISYEEEYDSQGWLIKITGYNEDGTIAYEL